MNLTLYSSLSLVPTEIQFDKKSYIVEDKVSGEFYEMPEVCIAAIKLINSGLTLGKIEDQLKDIYPNEEVNLLDFAEQLLEMELVAEVNGVKVDKKKKEQENQGYLSISPQLGKFFFNKIAYFVYAALFFLNVIFFIVYPALFPKYKDLFIFHYMFLNIPAWMVISFILVLIHEFGHVLAMRAFNLPARIEMGHRLFFVVLETDMTSVWKLPSKDRNILYLAGLCFDTVILSLALIAQQLLNGYSEFFLRIMSIIVLDTFIRMVYQCCIYMKTDLYYVFENISGCYNLMESAQQQIRKHIPFLKPAAKEEVVYDEERGTVLTYSIFYFFGAGVTILLFFTYYLPQLVYACRKVLPGFSQGTASAPFWDAVIFTLQFLLVLSLLFFSWKKKYSH
ncbi:hypothetical protein [Neobacillus mesonae]|uniref:hypothetical protein n=1 Tax=Neobacillus mesonae TaxID=1193713 RepID=UPI00203F1AC9|nr:hypothetical protein [Neobacillus mesonae]MCM3569166.1 hypothetical protein [Neobacillus mesonae]